MDAVALPLILREINPGLQYGYIPTEWICALFVALFSVSTLLHLGQALYFRVWWLLPTVVLGGLGEIIGWSGRLWSSKTFLGNALDPFLMQISSTIIAPTPMLAANFIILGAMIKYLGSQYSRLPPMWYSIIFCSVDVVALIIQAIGGASASQAAQSGNGDPEKGGHIMLAGIIIQLVAILFYACLSSEFLFRYLKDRPVRGGAAEGRRGILSGKLKLMLLGLLLSTLFIFIRAVYRTIELSKGWTGDVIRTQVWFNVFDGTMILLAIYAINFFHPGCLLNHLGVGKPRGKVAADDRLTSQTSTVVGASHTRSGTNSIDMKERQTSRIA